jgi:hypothetical protein
LHGLVPGIGIVGVGLDAGLEAIDLLPDASAGG